MRWQHPERGLLPPGAFIDTAEQLGLIDQIGRWVVTHVCRDGVAWAHGEDDPPPFISVNVSAHELHSERLLDDVAAALDQTGYAGTSMCFEITESAIIDDPHAAMATLRGLKELGALIALDDFGTGFSSLSQLARFPVDVVKLDRTFVADLTREDRRRTALVRAVVSMAEALDMKLIAEGIETPEQHELVLELGCRIGQGFLFGRPAPLDTLHA